MLIVEDTAVCRAMLKRVLTTLLYTCDEAEDGVIAVEKVRRSLVHSHQPDSLPNSVRQPNSHRQQTSLRSAPLQSHQNPGPQSAVQLASTNTITPSSPFATTNVDTTTAAMTPASVPEKPFDLILCDNIMPNMCGPEAVALMRKIGYRGPIFGVTGNTMTDAKLIIRLTPS